MRYWLALLALLALAGPVSAAAPPLPSDIWIKTPTQTFNSRFYYALHDGRIWIRPNRQVTGQDEPWQLMGCEGLPCEPENASFQVPKAIVQISADADELSAVDDRGYFYVRTSAGPGWFSKNEWVMHHGFPKNTLLIPDTLRAHRAMSMGRRHSDVMWHEDADNNVHHYGTMGTSSLYLLAPSGYEIWYTDNGLPADFSNQLCGPERGAFVAENLQASAGTLFVINRAGEMYTHMNDFDLNGGTSMFISYTYTAQPFRSQDKGTDYNTHLTPWRLPGHDWQKQPDIPLTGQARVSTDITILQNGQGNAARELRVAGQNAQGQRGYWFKPILASEWRFAVAPVQVDPERWTLPQYKGLIRVPVQDVSYRGPALGGRPDAPVQMELLNFNLQCSPATLRLTTPERQFDLKLHTVDAWINVKRRDPGRDGTPRLMLGTLEVPPEVLQELPEPFRRLHQKTYAIQLAATTDHVFLFQKKTGILGRLQRHSAIPASLKSFNYRFQMPVATFTAAMFRDANEKMLTLNDPSLLRLDLETLTPADLPELERLIALNQERLQDYEKGLELIHQGEQLAWQEAVGTALLRNAYYAINAPLWIPNASAVCRTAPELLWSYYAVDDYLNVNSESWYHHMIKLIKGRLVRYQERRELLQREARRATQGKTALERGFGFGN
ncbi:MAG: hypothetical protein ACO1RX_14755 [Candidatus Sericytochromatia bacterium]